MAVKERLLPADMNGIERRMIDAEKNGDAAIAVSVKHMRMLLSTIKELAIDFKSRTSSLADGLDSIHQQAREVEEKLQKLTDEMIEAARLF